MQARWLVVSVAAVLALGACGVAEEDADLLAPAPGSGTGIVDQTDRAALLDAVAIERCDKSLVGDEGGDVESIYRVVDGQLAGRCFGKPSEVVVDAWSTLAAVTPPQDLRLLAALATFKSDDDTLAFTVPVDDAYTRFVIAFNERTVRAGEQELRLTAVHEYAHVVTLAPDQLDVVSDPDDCNVYWNGGGCFRSGSYIDRWIGQFWTRADLRKQPEDGSTDDRLAEERCELSPRFLGQYAASSPEEDFAESFSAFVFDIDVPDSVQPKIDWFATVPQLAAYRDQRRASGLGQASNEFDRCG